MAESLNRFAGNRLILGLGAGAADAELRGFGLPVPTARDKVDGLAEAVEIIRGVWRQPAFSYAGRLHTVAGAELEPKPPQPIPVWLGTFGDRALAVTGRHADGWIPSLGYAGADRLARMRGQVLAAARAAGRSPGDVTCALHLEVSVGGADAGPDIVSGSPGQISGRLSELVEAGFTAFSFSPAGPRPASEQVEQLAADVIPRLR
jgi:alkanesulfonate monooxygenase SsuD/methylene tetrahydromethanopterin reductase-like flavin-dependent oxidoreductase (luciferase family)